MRSVTIFTLLFCICIRTAIASEISVINISNNWDLSQWQSKSFASKTEYTVVKHNSRQILKAATDNSASVLFKKIEIDLSKTPYLNWSWKVENTYSIADQKTKEGDDFPARVYVIFNEGILPWEALSLNYVWGNTEGSGEYWPNPFTPQAMMIPVESGKKGLGKWQSYKKNISQDFLRTFNKKIVKIHGIAIMADSDNAMKKAISYFGDISFSSN